MVNPQPLTISPPNESQSLIQFLLIIRRRWRLLAIVWAGTVALTMLYTLTTTKLYRPQATLEIRPEMPLVPSERDDLIYAGYNLWENYYRTQESILTSPSLLETVIKALPESIRRDYLLMSDGPTVLARQIEVEKARTSFILKVGCIDKDAQKAEQIVNTLVTVYIEDSNQRLRQVKSSAAEAMKKETLPDLRKDMDAASNALQDYQALNGFLDLEERHKALLENWHKVDARLSERRLTRVRLRSEVTALTGYKEYGVAGLFNPKFNEAKALEKLATDRVRILEDLARDSKMFKEKHPRILELQTQLATVEKEILEAVTGTLTALEMDLKEAEGEEASLEKELQRLEGDIAEVGRKLAQYRKLDAELAALKDLYTSYLKKHGDVAATSATGLGSVRIVDGARVPDGPYRPRILINLALGGLLGLLLGGAAMLVTDGLDNRIQSPEEVEAFVGLDVLAVIPKLRGTYGEAPALLEKQSNLVEFESFRGLRSELVTRLEKIPGAKVIAILSPMQSEGKTTVTVNIAQALALEGRKILIFDADMRRPAMKQFVSENGPGLENVVSGEATLEQAARSSKIPGVDVVGAREGTSGAAELASSPRFEAALRDARERYDIVFIDSAPVIPASESVLIARRADAAILVLREGQTGRGAARGAKRRLESAQVRMLGAVLNCAIARGGAYGYGYAYYYGKRGYYHDSKSS